MLFDIHKDMSMSVLYKINKIVTDITGIEGGRGMKFTLDRVAIYDNITEDEADRIVSNLEKEFCQGMFNLINPTYYEYSEDDDDYERMEDEEDE